MTDIHYFPRYTQPENFVTNNTLLPILRLNQYSRFKFEKFMGLLCEDSDVQLATSWLQFNQQQATTRSVLDGFISQDSVKIAVETKLGLKFNPDQLRRHLEVFGNEQHKLLILLSPSEIADKDPRLTSVCAEARSRNIQVVCASFADIVRSARDSLSPHDEEMHALVDDYESFCSERGLLPVDEQTIFVPPCSRSFTENVKYRLYYCPAVWTRRKARFLGIYANRSVRFIGQIGRVIACDVDLTSGKVSATDAHETLSPDEQDRILGAAKDAQGHGWNLSKGHKFYLCDALEETNFSKRSHGGIMGHRYFDLAEVLGCDVPKNLAKLAELLRGRNWPERE